MNIPPIPNYTQTQFLLTCTLSKQEVLFTETVDVELMWDIIYCKYVILGNTKMEMWFCSIILTECFRDSLLFVCVTTFSFVIHVSMSTTNTHTQNLTDRTITLTLALLACTRTGNKPVT